MVDVYDPQMVTTPTGNNVASPAVQVAVNIPCTIHQGKTDPLDETFPTGVIQNSDTEMYFDLYTPVGSVNAHPGVVVDMTQILVSRNLIVDALGQVWLIRGDPIRRARFPQTSHVKVKVEKQTFSIDNVPIVDQ